MGHIEPAASFMHALVFQTWCYPAFTKLLCRSTQVRPVHASKMDTGIIAVNRVICSRTVQVWHSKLYVYIYVYTCMYVHVRTCMCVHVRMCMCVQTVTQTQLRCYQAKQRAKSTNT